MFYYKNYRRIEKVSLSHNKFHFEENFMIKRTYKNYYIVIEYKIKL
jgi:hypothetical protein